MDGAGSAPSYFSSEFLSRDAMLYRRLPSERSTNTTM